MVSTRLPDNYAGEIQYSYRPYVGVPKYTKETGHRSENINLKAAPRNLATRLPIPLQEVNTLSYLIQRFNRCHRRLGRKTPDDVGELRPYTSRAFCTYASSALKRSDAPYGKILGKVSR